MSKNIKSIIIDDEENARMYLARMLALSFPDIEIEFAVSPAEALFVLDNKKVDLIFLDVEMPGMTGLELLSRLREAGNENPAIFVSMYNRPEFIQKALRLGAVDYLDKPVDPDELETAVKKILNSQNNKSVAGNAIETIDKIYLKTNKGTLYVTPAEIICFETNKRESFIHSTGSLKGVVVKDNLVNLEKILPANTFQRVSRQFIVNVDFIKLVRRDKTLILQTPYGEMKIEKIYPHFIEKYVK